MSLQLFGTPSLIACTLDRERLNQRLNREPVNSAQVKSAQVRTPSTCHTASVGAAAGMMQASGIQGLRSGAAAGSSRRAQHAARGMARLERRRMRASAHACPPATEDRPATAAHQV